jgi:hypothetical protein
MTLATSSGGWNTALSYYALTGNDTGDNNVAIGFHALDGNTTGGDNIAIGNTAGSAITTTSNNIFIGNTGELGDNQTIRIGSEQTANYTAGIYGSSSYTGDHRAVYVDASNKLHSALAGQSVLLGELFYENPTTDTCALTFILPRKSDPQPRSSVVLVALIVLPTVSCGILGHSPDLFWFRGPSAVD